MARSEISLCVPSIILIRLSAEPLEGEPKTSMRHQPLRGSYLICPSRKTLPQCHPDEGTNVPSSVNKNLWSDRDTSVATRESKSPVFTQDALFLRQQDQTKPLFNRQSPNLFDQCNKVSPLRFSSPLSQVGVKVSQY